MAARQYIPDHVERPKVTRGDASATRIQRAATPASPGGRIDARGLTPQTILHLQRTAGNAAVNALLNGRTGRGASVQREEDTSVKGSAHYEAVQRHVHRIHDKPQGTNVWNTAEETE